MKKNYTISIPRSQFWTIVVPLALLLVVAGGLGGMFAIDRLVMPHVVGIANKGVLEVPGLVGTQWQEARQRLYDIGLRLEISDREYNGSIDKGVIITQQPPQGERVKKGRHVCVIVSDGSEVAQLPSVAKLTEAAAKRVLRDAGFVDVSVSRVYDEKHDKDVVVGTEPPAGVRTSRELPIVVRLSKGPRPTHSSVPNVIGEMLSEARVAIEDSGLLVGNVEYRVTSSSRPGTVVSQSVSPGTNVPLESTVDLVVATGS